MSCAPVRGRDREARVETRNWAFGARRKRLACSLPPTLRSMRPGAGVDVTALSTGENEMTAPARRRLFAASERAADKVWRDSFKDFFYSYRIVDPQAIAAGEHLQLAAKWRSWCPSHSRSSMPASVEGERFRESAFNVSRLALQGRSFRRGPRCGLHRKRSAARSARLRTCAQRLSAPTKCCRSSSRFEAGATTNWK